MFYHDKKLQYKVRVDKPNPLFAKMLQQAIGGIEGEIRVCMQYLFQAWNSRGPAKYRDMLLETGTEEISHIEMLSTAVALNLEGAAPAIQEDVASKNPLVQMILGGMDPRHYLSGGLGAMPADSNGVPFNGSWVVSSGNLAVDMRSNVMAESGGRLLAIRLFELTDDPGMRDMLSFLIARDTMHQQQWLAVLEEIGALRDTIPNTFPRDLENQDFNYKFVVTNINPEDSQAQGRWTQGQSLDGMGTFDREPARPYGQEPKLSDAPWQAHAQKAQTKDSDLK
ncbi:manganese catalase family protein [Cesiribacter andamanensis]|uniref:Putative manganese catalase n=1 Tax=Cesiribacter andamanensis AMV16 TaxID=1279009 RepID=M7NAT0_9BACT|nr:manganese catalase family protein [Cesiribacter andamanensis]EMR04372.1 putative manganese catalase [Cesiribacter andamanensis AMV16]